MQTTIDGAGRIVVPKALREALQLSPGQRLDIAVSDGRLEIEVAATPASVEVVDGLPRIVPDQQLPVLTADLTRDVLEQIRR